jgi:hypothetical protein
MKVAQTTILPQLERMNSRPTKLLYRDMFRIGFQEQSEVGWFIQELKQMGIELWDASRDKGVDPKNDMAEILNFITLHQASVKEIEERGKRARLGRRKTIEKGSSPGKLLTFGYDWGGYGADGKLKYRITQSFTTLPVWQPNYTGRRKHPILMKRLKQWTNGTSEPYDDTAMDVEGVGLKIVNRHPPKAHTTIRFWKSATKNRRSVSEPYLTSPIDRTGLRQTKLQTNLTSVGGERREVLCSLRRH